MSTYTNRLGQTLVPGDKVVVIAQGCSHSIIERHGTFVGVSASGYPQVRVSKRRYVRGTGPSWRLTSGMKDVEVVGTYSAGRVYRLG